jgi:aspartyl-tRNA(Asn)/glutamyl-tRNA(Gln) amidotransferase subunit C
MDKEGVKKLAELSRLELTEAEIEEYAGEFSDILSYVDSLKGAVSDTDENQILESSANRNIIREDENPHESGIHTDTVVESAPDSQDNYIKVKKVL